jgi:hypothetical protein
MKDYTITSAFARVILDQPEGPPLLVEVDDQGRFMVSRQHGERASPLVTQSGHAELGQIADRFHLAMTGAEMDLCGADTNPGNAAAPAVDGLEYIGPAVDPALAEREAVVQFLLDRAKHYSGDGTSLSQHFTIAANLIRKEYHLVTSPAQASAALEEPVPELPA